jgi:hypothetical protein
MTTPKSKGKGRKASRVSSRKASQSIADDIAALTKPIAFAPQRVNINAAFDKQAAEYKVLYEASLALAEAVEEGDANVFIRDDDRSHALQSLHRILDGEKP